MKKYYDTDGNEVTLHKLVRLEPEWAVSRIKVGEELESTVESLTKELDAADQCVVDGLMKRKALEKELAEAQDSNADMVTDIVNLESERNTLRQAVNAAREFVEDNSRLGSPTHRAMVEAINKVKAGALV